MIYALIVYLGFLIYFVYKMELGFDKIDRDLDKIKTNLDEINSLLEL